MFVTPENKSLHEERVEEAFNLTYLDLFPLGKSPRGKGMGINMKTKHKIDKRLWTRRIFLMAYDAMAVVAASFFALLTRFNFYYSDVEPRYLQVWWQYLPYIIVITLILFFIFRLYHSMWTYAGIPELQNIVSACVTVSICQVMLIILTGSRMPRSYYFLFMIYLFFLVMCSRFFYRLVRIKRNQWLIRNDKSIKNVMIIGAGEAGNQIIKDLVASKEPTARITCIIDDNLNKVGKYIHGIKVVGNREDIIEAAEYYQIDKIIIAMPSVSKKVIRDVLMICKETNCDIKILPSVGQMVDGKVTISQMRSVAVEDLLGREPVKIDLNSVMTYVQNKVVLVTGAGGSIGSELCRQLAEYRPAQLILLDINENYVYELQQELTRKFANLNFIVQIASIRDTRRINEVMQNFHPDIVYHAAAHKHVPLMEMSPNEAVKNNVFATYKTAEAAAKSGVKRFIMISSDKAVNPTNVMGATKRICEMLIQSMNRRYKTEFVAVRFGNVLGSNGSVIPLFQKQIEEGGPVTVTHPEVVRYFMTIPEAVSLVLQAGAYAKGGEIFILDMGEPVKILELARNMIRLSGYIPDEEIKIEITGLRPGEKLYEEMLMKEEGMEHTPNEMIHIGKPIEFDEEKFYSLLEELRRVSCQENGDVHAILQKLVPGFHKSDAKQVTDAGKQ